MRVQKIFWGIIISSCVFAGLSGNMGCANIIPPQGGPKDTLPPVLLTAEPRDSALHFSGDKITLNFNEFIEVRDIGNNLIFSPTPEINPYVDYKLKTVTVKLKDALLPNTTYSINFGNAIQDFTEGNPLKNFTYTFSTGSYIDSLTLQGQVINAKTGEPDSTMIVMLHTSGDDSAVVNKKPLYVTKSDGNGHFQFNNLPPGKFYLYALQDNNRTRRYLSDDVLFAFADKPVTIQPGLQPITLYAYIGKPANETNKNQAQVSNEAKRLTYHTNLVSNKQELFQNFILTSDRPLQFFDSTKLKLYKDSTFVPVQDYTIEEDSTHTHITLATDWQENTLYHLVLDKDFATDSSGYQLLKKDSLHFMTKQKSDYGKLKITFRNLDMQKNPVVWLMQQNKIIRSVPLLSNTMTIEMFPPGEYTLRILYDNNKNGEWDPGIFFGQHIQPELVQPIKRKILVKAAWQNEFEIAL